MTKKPEILLQAAAATLKEQWPGMSVRSVAAKLKVSPSYWSKILRGEKPLTQTLLPRVVKVLALDAQQTAALQRSILETIESEQLSPATGIRTTREHKSSPVETYRNLGREDFWLLEDWYYIPVLNFFTLPEARRTNAEIARRLGLNSEQVSLTVQRLLQQGFLRKNEKGSLERTELQVRFPTDRSHTVVRKYHQSMLQRASTELSRQNAAESFERRLISAVSFAGSSAKIKEARLILEEAMYRAANLMAEEPVADELYQLNIQIFPLTKTK